MVLATSAQSQSKSLTLDQQSISNQSHALQDYQSPLKSKIVLRSFDLRFNSQTDRDSSLHGVMATPRKALNRLKKRTLVRLDGFVMHNTSRIYFEKIETQRAGAGQPRARTVPGSALQMASPNTYGMHWTDVSMQHIKPKAFAAVHKHATKQHDAV
ncbi:hypothetical protein ASPFODRAFT_28856 [Aspergillus luchuensis CBS 106.47]|uniref:Uncharacterized protein n=1 Tax=Aspergillus luchuensis (strain CBS 106.47) TaxID=1137211 RepID=A0A1M3TUT0_ASPLC|nr:hypothetical protein ASPFODRAFT_28856 [Aspergillus luchuensis CBS 106.47]